MVSGLRDGGAGRRLRLGMVGGGRGAFIGAVHRLCARMDDTWELIAGALSSDPERARESAADLMIAADRAYPDYRAMAAAEAGRPDRIDAVSIVTPNDSHHAVARAFLDRGIHVICDKPMTNSLEDALDLVEAVRKTGLVFGLTHNYTGYPMVRQARDMVAAGELGRLRLIQVEYVQDWLSTKLEDSGHKQAGWRTDPGRSGIGGSLGDIGTHAHNLAGFVSGLPLQKLAADLASFVPGRRLDDNAHVMLRYADGARGLLWASQVAPGNENALRLRVYGEKGGLTWSHERHTELTVDWLDGPTQVLHAASPYLSAPARAASRVPTGHPEGFIEAFANLYRDFAEAIAAGRPDAGLVPGIADGVRGMAFVERAVAASRAGEGWVELEHAA